jgi:hypothetical protein
MTVNLLWLQYDLNQQGYLDTNQAFLFTKEVLNTLEPNLQMSQHSFNTFYPMFDTDHGGTLDK